MLNRLSTSLTIGFGFAIAATMTSPALANGCDDSGLGVLPNFCTLSFSGTSGEWTGYEGDADDVRIFTSSYSGKEFIRWGDPANHKNRQSAYSFKGVQPLEDIQVGKAFNLGSFTHYNNVISSSGGAVDSADLTVRLDFDGIIPAKDFQYTFNHEETLNAGTCEYNLSGDHVPCADRVTWENAIDDQEFEFEYNGYDYVLEIAGFRRDGDSGIVDEFITTEHQANNAFLMGLIKHIAPPDQPAAVPEPAAALGLLAFGAVASKLKRNPLG